MTPEIETNLQRLYADLDLLEAPGLELPGHHHDGRGLVVWRDGDGLNFVVMPPCVPKSLWERLRVAWHWLRHGVAPAFAEPVVILRPEDESALRAWLGTSRRDERLLN